jgi:hypothetical protein
LHAEVCGEILQLVDRTNTNLGHRPLQGAHARLMADRCRPARGRNQGRFLLLALHWRLPWVKKARPPGSFCEASQLHALMFESKLRLQDRSGATSWGDNESGYLPSNWPGWQCLVPFSPRSCATSTTCEDHPLLGLRQADHRASRPRGEPCAEIGQGH